MKIKLILGLITGVVVTTQISIAQGIVAEEYQPKLEAFAADNSFTWPADGEWLSSCTPTVQMGLAAVDNNGASNPSIPSSDGDVTTTSPDNLDNSPIGAMAGSERAAASVAAPEVSRPLPEPSTGGLLALGGVALAAGALRRRKSAA
jgi:hypothetical protein